MTREEVGGEDELEEDYNLTVPEEPEDESL